MKRPTHLNSMPSGISRRRLLVAVAGGLTTGLTAGLTSSIAEMLTHRRTGLALGAGVAGSTAPAQAVGAQSSSTPPQPTPPQPTSPQSTLVTPHALRIVFSGELDGELEPCGCPGGAAGGFPRRVAALAWLKRTQDPWSTGKSPGGGPPLLALDSGNALLRPELTRSRIDTAQQAHARRIGRLLAASDIKAVAVGVRDLLALEVPGIQALARETGISWISANIEHNGRLAFPASLSVLVGGVSVAILGVTAPHPALEARLGLRIRDPNEVLPPLVRGLQARHSLVILLSNQNPEDVTRLAGVEGIDLILSGGPAGGTLQSWGRRPPWGVRVPGAGRSLALLDFRLGLPAAGRSSAVPLAPVPLAPVPLAPVPLQPNGQLERRMIELEGHEHALRMLIEQIKQEEGKANPKRLEAESAWLRQKVQQLHTDPPQPVGSRIFCARLLGLDGSLGEEPGVLSRIR